MRHITLTRRWMENNRPAVLEHLIQVSEITGWDIRACGQHWEA